MRTLLMVDDDPVVRKLGMLAFGKLGSFNAMEASSGEMALTVLDRIVPDVVVLDVMMTGMDGPETLLKIREKHPNLPVIFLTGQAEPDQVKHLLSLKPAGILAKPFDHKAIGKAVHAILDSLGR
jgi:two-component system, OmpR family, response regulator